MNVESAVFSLVSIEPHKVKELVRKLPYSQRAVYVAVKSLEEKGLIERRGGGREVVVEVSRGYMPQKLREIYIKCLSFGVDPGFLLDESTVDVWKSLRNQVSLREIQNVTGLSYNWVRRIVRFLFDSNLVTYIKRKPAIVCLKKEHELNVLLDKFFSEDRGAKKLFYPGVIPFERLVQSPEGVERMLYDKIDEGLAIRGTGFLVKGRGKLSVVESVGRELSVEEIFLREIETPEGVEDFCIKLVESGEMDYDRLLKLSKERNMVNVVGCYLDILNSIKGLVDSSIIEKFRKSISKRRRVFLKAFEKYGKEGWEKTFEERWNVDLYLDIGAIRHGIEI